MRSMLILSFIIFILGSSVFAQDSDKDFAGVDPNAPVFKFDQEVHDFGEIEEGTKAMHEFSFTNIGKVPLIITKVRASCGCTTPEWPEQPIMPGKIGVIKIVFDSKARPGTFKKAITISSNSSTPTKILYINGTVKTGEGVQEGTDE